jgi:hypothetical protein
LKGLHDNILLSKDTAGPKFETHSAQFFNFFFINRNLKDITTQLVACSLELIHCGSDLGSQYIKAAISQFKKYLSGFVTSSENFSILGKGERNTSFL